MYMDRLQILLALSFVITSGRTGDRVKRPACFQSNGNGPCKLKLFSGVFRLPQISHEEALGQLKGN